MPIKPLQALRVTLKIKRLLKKEFPFFEEKLHSLILSEENAIPIYGKLAFFLGQTGFPDKASQLYEIILKKISPKDLNTKYSLYLKQYMQLMLNYTSPTLYPKDRIKKKAAYYGRKYAGLVQQRSFSTDTNSHKKLRLGLTCHFFDDPTSQLLLVPVLQHMDKTKIELFIYSDQDPSITSEFTRNAVEHWIDSSDFTDDQLAVKILEDKIDIFMELNGWTEKNRLKMLNQRVAPLQGTTYNITSTSGIDGVDFHLGEHRELEDASYYNEQDIALPDSLIPSIFLPIYPDINELPSIKNNFITFGCFGAVHKISKEIIQLWCEILNRVPHSKFIMKARELDNPEILRLFQYHFSNYTDIKRIAFEGNSPFKELLLKYNTIDIALDTNPHAGGTTNINATYMGVPTISYNMGRPISLCNALPLSKHLELMAYTKENFIQKAVDLANDPSRLQQYKKTLRHDLAQSPNSNIQTFSDTMTSAYLQIWQAYLKGTLKSLNTTSV